MKYKYFVFAQFLCLLSMSINGWFTPFEKTWHSFWVHNVWWMISYWSISGILIYWRYRSDKKEEAEFQRRMLEIQEQNNKMIQEWQTQYNESPECPSGQEPDCKSG